MDQILTMGATFTMILGAIAGILGGALYAMIKKILKARNDGQSYSEILRQQGLFIAVWLCLFLMFLGYLRVQSVMRPKNTLDSQNAALQEKLKQLDSDTLSPANTLPDTMPNNSIPGVISERPAQKNVNYSEKNQQENRDAVQHFQSIQ